MFLDDNFLLQNEWAKTLFHKFAKDESIIDYHCHLEPAVIYQNKIYNNLTQLWLNDGGAGDHYKWRLMRANGIPERLISGEGDDYEKFLAFVSTIENAIGNPIYEWSHLELRRYFGINLTITKENAPKIWGLANAKITTTDYRPQKLLQAMNVKVVCTTDDPTDTLDYHKLLSAQEMGFKVLPTFRADNVWNLQNPEYKDYLQTLSFVSDIAIENFSDLMKALDSRVSYFNSVGGRLADHGLNTFVYASATEEELDNILSRVLQGETKYTANEVDKFVTAIQLNLMRIYTEYGWTMQMHMNALRNNSTKMHRKIGINVGGDSMGDQPSLTSNVVSLFAIAEEAGDLPRTILYSLNPNDWLPLVTAMQSFQGGMVQKLQLGCAWWFNDTCEGMRNQLTMMAQQSLLGHFAGMLTDSRSFLSYPRHEYFRRVLCGLIGEWVEQGRIPADELYLGKIIKAICYKNAHDYFGFFNN